MTEFKGNSEITVSIAIWKKCHMQVWNYIEMNGLSYQVRFDLGRSVTDIATILVESLKSRTICFTCAIIKNLDHQINWICVIFIRYNLFNFQITSGLGLYQL